MERIDRTNAEIRAVLFDADGVIQRTKPEWLEQLKKLCGDPEGVEQFLHDVFAAEGPCLVGAADFEVSLASVLRRWKSTASVSEVLAVWRMIDPDDAVLQLIRTIRSQGTLVALATNQQQYRASYMLNELGYTNEFDYIFCSCFLGCAKPAAEYFTKALEILDLPAKRVLFIDDHKANVEAATRVGLQACQFHLDDGVGRMVSLLNSYGLSVR